MWGAWKPQGPAESRLPEGLAPALDTEGGLGYQVGYSRQGLVQEKEWKTQESYIWVTEWCIAET